MLHGPCGADNPRCPCMQDGRCSKSFPKPFNSYTTIGDDCYPNYRRRRPGQEEGAGGHTTTVRVSRTRQDVEVDNRSVVPYNPWLLLKFRAHINVEFCASIKAIKYLYKYVFKGHDKATVTMEAGEDRVDVRIPEDVNEPDMYENKRYIGASEACWRIFNFNLQVSLLNIFKRNTISIHICTCTFTDTNMITVFNKTITQLSLTLLFTRISVVKFSFSNPFLK